jgi:argininosuccinate lyase
MPHKRNPDLLELARSRAAAIEGDLATVLALRAKLTSGYHRDFQLLKEPLIRGLSRTLEALGIMRLVVPELQVDRQKAQASLGGGLLATDEVMRRVESGTPFRRAYRDVATALQRGERFPEPPPSRLMARRTSTGGLGALGLDLVWRRWKGMERWCERERLRFDRAMKRLAGPRRSGT